MVEDGIAEKENKENSEATEEAASADTEGRKEESPEAGKDMENIEDIREDSAKKEEYQQGKCRGRDPASGRRFHRNANFF